MRTEVVIRSIILGEHYYPGAVLKSIARRHQHEFAVLIRIHEKHSREIEWIALKEELYKFFGEHWPSVLKPNGRFIDFDAMSCEDIGLETAKFISKKYQRPMSIQVDEMDEQCGAAMYFTEAEVEELSKKPYVPIEDKEQTKKDAYTT